MNNATPPRAPAPRGTPPSTAKTVPPFRRVPLMDCRLYAANLLDLFQDLLRRIYEAGPTNKPVFVMPTMTVGEAFGLTEKYIAVALVVPDSSGAESVLLSLLRNIALQQGQDADDAESIVNAVRYQFINPDLPTFEAIADALENSMQHLAGVTQDQVDQSIGLLRSVGMLITDLIELKFPLLSRARIDIGRDPERYLEISGSYTVTFPAKADDLLQLAIENDRLEIKVKLEAVTIDGASSVEFFKVKDKKNGTKTTTPLFTNLLLNIAENSLGDFFFGDVTLTVTFDDKLDPPTDYPWAPNHEVRRAAWTQSSFDVDLGEVRMQVYGNTWTVLAAFLDGDWGDVGELENHLEQMIEDEVEDSQDLFGLAGRLADVVEPVALRLIPVAHALSRVRYGPPFEGVLMDAPGGLSSAAGARAIELQPQTWDPVFDVNFDDLHTYWKGRCAQVRNPQPEAPVIESEPYDDPVLHWPDNLDDLDPDLNDWIWPDSSGTGLVQLDLSQADARRHALDTLARASGLDARARAVAALAVEGLAPRQIGLLRPDAIEKSESKVLGHTVQGQTLGWVLEVQTQAQAHAHAKATSPPPFVFHDTAFTGRADQVTDLLRFAQRRVLALVQPPVGGTQTLDWVPPFDPGIWTTNCDPESPLASSHGSAADPCWYGLSTNCVLPTLLYRQLNLLNKLRRSGSVKIDGQTLSWQVKACNDVAADFTGAAPSGAPGLALGQLRVALGLGADTQVDFRADLRVRLKPRFHGNGCIADDEVTVISNALACLGGMFGVNMPVTTRMRQIEFRDFMVLSIDITDIERDIEIVSLARADGQPLAAADSGTVRAQLRSMVKPWLAAVPEPPILYNPFRPLGGQDGHFFAQGGWLCLNRHYDFPDFSGLSA